MGLLTKRQSIHLYQMESRLADKDETYYTPKASINVIKFACNAPERVHVTDGCQGCLAHPCMEGNQDAVSLDRTTENL